MWEELMGPDYGPKALKKLKPSRAERLKQEQLEKLTATLIRHLPGIWEGGAKFIAKALLKEPEESESLYHRGADDRKSIRKIRGALEKSLSGLDELSPWSRQALMTTLYPICSGYLRQVPKQNFPHDFETVQNFLDDLVWVMQSLEDLLKRGSPHNGKNWPAIAVIDAARKIWKSHTGRQAPRRSLNEETKFARFLRDLVDDLSIGANMQAAFRAWAEESQDPNSHFFPTE